MINIKNLITLYETLTPEEWTTLYNQAASGELPADIIAWNNQYTDPTNAAVLEFNELYKAIQTGNLAELDEETLKQVKAWNLIK